MCLGVPGCLVEVDREAAVGVAEVSGTRRPVSLALIDGLEVGDWVVIHLGFALAQIDEDTASAALAQLQEMGDAYEVEMDALRSPPTRDPGRR